MTPFEEWYKTYIRPKKVDEMQVRKDYWNAAIDKCVAISINRLAHNIANEIAKLREE